MKEVGKIKDACTVIAGQSPLGASFNSYGDGLFRYCISDGGISMCGDPLPADNMGKQDTFEEFLAWGLDNYPAKKTGVILFDHGRGIQGVCFDTYGMDRGQENPLRVTETSRALDNVLTARGIDKLEFVGYDACLMQLQDVAEFNSRYFNYMIGSEEEELAESMWDYDAWLPLLFANEDTLTILKGIDQRFEELAGLLLDHKSQGYTFAASVNCNYYGQWSHDAQPLQHGMVDCVQYLNGLKREYNTKADYGEIPSSMAEQVVTKIDAVLSVLLNDARLYSEQFLANTFVQSHFELDTLSHLIVETNLSLLHPIKNACLFYPFQGECDNYIKEYRDSRKQMEFDDPSSSFYHKISSLIFFSHLVRQPRA